jgi:flagellar hook-associated protein 3 FlgL
MRVTDNHRYQSASRAMARSAERLQKLTDEATTGVRVGKPSDDPTAYAAMVRKDAEIAKLEARQTMLARAEGDISLSESTLASASDIVIRARELATQMADGTYSASDRAVAAAEVTQLREQLIGLANTQGARGHLFAGTAVDAAPFTPAGAFVGNDDTMGVAVADGVNLAANASGAKAFTAAGGRDVFADLASLQNALATNNVAGVQSSLGDLDAGLKQIVGVRAGTGATLERMRSASSTMDGALIAVRSARATDVESDALTVLQALSQAQSSYEQSIAVARKLLDIAGSAQRF